ncbi:pyridoxal phosphate-dependent transferase [Zychaea mexicana]|uniref:pyridoxal phosphate-dependent transferase n=1 Tax=Zychaea mexicana TaxID=64656 RepID=UPI0022FE17A0|nr:pyridoxal phosphate-dependent transferase [Zychaea mexicana]KAI9494039.1 pyridoxal phosphate-dependent transferase [Zychaea mexicana]
MTNSKTTPFGKAMRSHFYLEDNYVPLNHGSFGVCPRSLHSLMRHYQEESEKHPDRFLKRQVFKDLYKNRERLAALVHAHPQELAFVVNASYGINSVVRSGFMQPGDKLLFFTTAYNAVERTMTFLQDAHKVKLVPVELNYPLLDQEILDLAKETIEQELAKDPDVPIRLAVFDAISSVPAARFPFEAMIKLVREYDIYSLVDGAHAIGQIPLDLHKADPDFFVSNCHKWGYAPRGCAFLYVPKRNQALVHPSVINYAYKDERSSGISTSFEEEFAWPGTVDFSTYLCINAAFDFRESIGGEEAIQKYCNDLARQGGQLVAEALGTEVLENQDKTLTVAMTNIRLPFLNKRARSDGEIINIIVDKCIYEHNTMCSPYKHNGQWFVRLSAQVYNDLDDFRYFADEIQKVLRELEDKNE